MATAERVNEEYNVGGKLTTEKKRRNLLKLMSIAGSAVLVPILAVSGLVMQTQGAKATTLTYYYDAQKEAWIKDVQEVSLPPDPDGTQPRGSNTVIIRLGENNPVKQIVLLETLVISSNNSSEPRLEIAGHDTGGSGQINIGTLLFKKVDAARLNIHDTDAVRLQLENAVAQDDELDIDVTIVNAVRTGRGGPSSLFIGTTRSALASFLTVAGIPDIDNLPNNLITPNENGIRVDRIRILGPSSGTAFVERILVVNTSVFGELEVKDVGIQDLILRDVTVDDSP